MANGRCAGCGRTGPEKKVNGHVVQCPAYLALPYAAQTGPAEAYEQWQAEGKAEARVERKEMLTGQEAEKRTAADARWATPKDMLEE